MELVILILFLLLFLFPLVLSLANLLTPAPCQVFRNYLLAEFYISFYEISDSDYSSL